MKKLFVFITLSMCVIRASAETIGVILEGSTSSYYYEFVSCTDSILTVAPHKGKPIELYPQHISEIKNDRNSFKIISIVDGKFVITDNPRFVNKHKEESRFVGDPNLAIANALKKTGAFSMAIGVPMLAIGTALVGYGYGSGTSTLYGRVHSQAEADCQTAGLVLMGVGGGMTLMGIPLYVNAKKAIKVQLNAKSNGAGVALNF